MFKPGDRVVRISGSHIGEYARVIQVCGPHKIYIEFERTDIGNHHPWSDHGWSCSPPYIKLVSRAPQTPFEADVQSYIDSELRS